jgi:hypothetical protein
LGDVLTIHARKDRRWHRLLPSVQPPCCTSGTLDPDFSPHSQKTKYTVDINPERVKTQQRLFPNTNGENEVNVYKWVDRTNCKTQRLFPFKSEGNGQGTTNSLMTVRVRTMTYLVLL